MYNHITFNISKTVSWINLKTVKLHSKFPFFKTMGFFCLLCYFSKILLHVGLHRPSGKRNKTDPKDVPKSLVWFRSFLKSRFREILDKPTQRH